MPPTDNLNTTLALALIVFVVIWIRGTVPRVRYDQLMAFGWKFLLPASLLNLRLVAGVIAWLG